MRQDAKLLGFLEIGGWQPSNLLDLIKRVLDGSTHFIFEAQSWRGRDLIWQEVYMFFYHMWVAGPSGSRLSTSGPAHSCAQAMQRMAVAHTKTMRSASTMRMMETIMRLHGGMNWRPHLIGRIHWLVYMYFATDFYWSDFSNLPQQKTSRRKTLWSNSVLKESFPFLRLSQDLRVLSVLSSHLSICQEDTGLCEFRAGFGGVDESQEEWSASQCRLDPGLRVVQFPAKVGEILPICNTLPTKKEVINGFFHFIYTLWNQTWKLKTTPLENEKNLQNHQFLRVPCFF